jgi:hypothetical protein
MSALLGVTYALALGQANSQDWLSFLPAESNSFSFDTGVLRGKLHADGMSKGLSAVLHVPTGVELDRSLGLCSHYRVFTANKRYGVAAWEWDSHAQLASDGSVVVDWPATGERPFELHARYHWAAPNALDVETTVVAITNLQKFESFLACYFVPSFSNSLVYVRELPIKPGIPGFMAAERNLGPWLAFPRDASAMQIIRDGRWKLLPNPVDWVLMPPLAKPIAVRRAPSTGLTSVLMSPPNECFAVCMPEQNDPHYSLYLSLFGQDVPAGQSLQARARLLIGISLSDADILAEYGKYVEN